MTEADPQGDAHGPPTDPPPPAGRPRRARRKDRRRRRAGGAVGLGGALVAFLLVFALGVGGWLASGRAIVAPHWVADAVEDRAALALGGRGRIEVERIAVVLTDAGLPRVALRGIRLIDADGVEIARAPELRVRLDPRALLRREVRVQRITLDGARIALQRDAEGRFGVFFGATAALDPARLRAAVERVLSGPAFAGAEAELTDLSLSIADVASGRTWQAAGGRLSFAQPPGLARRATLEIALAAKDAPPGAAPARLSLTASAAPGEPLAFEARLEGTEATDLAAHLAGAPFVLPLDSPVTARLGGLLAPEGRLLTLDADLSLGAGRLVPAGGAAPVAFQSVEAALSLDPARRVVSIRALTAETEALRLTATGQALLPPPGAADPDVVVQLALSDLVLSPPGALSRPARFGAGSVDLRLTRDPLRVDLGQLTLTEGEDRLTARGWAEAGGEGWQVALDARADGLSAERLVALWPLRAVPRTRDWLARNLTGGRAEDAQAALRWQAGQRPVLSLTYGFRDASLRFLPTLPPVTGAWGRSSIEDGRMAVVVEGGTVTSPAGGPIDVAGTVFTIPDLFARPTMAEVDLRTDSTILDALALLDLPPFRFLEKAGRSPDLAFGRARLATRLELPLIRDLKVEQVDFRVAGTLTEVESGLLVPGRTLRAEALAVAADGAGISVSGPGRLGGAAFDAGWSQPFGPGSAGQGRVEGTVTLDAAFLDEFGIDLPPGTLSGAGAGQITIELPREAPPRFRLVSDLNRLSLSIPALGWSKGPAATGRLEVAGTLGRPAAVERLALSAPGLEATGRVDLTEGGALEAARFDRVRAGGWLDAAVTLTPRGAGRAPAVALSGGSLDLRRLRTGGGGSGGGGGPITARLDRVTVSEGIVFTDLRGDLTTAGGLSGRFTARLGGLAPVVGTLAPTEEGTAVRLQAEDAGGVLSASGLIRSAVGGRMDLTLVPQPGQGVYAGRLSIADIGLRGAPALAALLSAVSVVGLLEQLNGQGLYFNEVSGEFTLSPEGVTLHRGSAVGASMGVSMSGIYDLRSRAMDMQGTISPLYLLNGIGSILTRRGEGLFGFTYRMTGPAAAPVTTVNPLSILTPGMFREIFRAAPPRLTQ